MKHSTESHDELGLLAAALCEGEITPAEAARLEALANRSSEARQFFLHYVQLHGELLWDTGAAAAPSEAFEADVRRRASRQARSGRGERTPLAAKSPRSRHRWITPMMAAAALLVAAALGVVLHHSWFEEPQTAGDSPVVARLSRTFRAQWASRCDVREGQALRSGRSLDLRAGLAAIRFECGAEVILEGPASLRLGAPSQAHLDSGRLTATVAEPAGQLVVYTPDCAISHQGTQFGVEAPLGGPTEVHVFEGAVGVRPRAESADRPDAHTVAAAEAIRVAARWGSRLPQVDRIDVDSDRFARHWPRPGSAAGLRALVAEHPDLIHHYTFEGVTRREKLEDKRGGLGLVEVVMYGGDGDGELAYCGGVDATTSAIRPHRDPAQGKSAGVGLQSEARGDAQHEARFIPPPAFTIELLVSFDGFAGAAEGQVGAAIATRAGERDCGFFLAAVDQGRLVHLMDRDAEWVSSDVECAPGDWYYVASTFRVGGGRTTVNTYVANVSRGETSLRHAVDQREALGEPAAGPLGVGKGLAENGAHAYPWPGMLDEVAIYDKVLPRSTLEGHLRQLARSRE